MKICGNEAIFAFCIQMWFPIAYNCFATFLSTNSAPELLDITPQKPPTEKHGYFPPAHR